MVFLEPSEFLTLGKLSRTHAAYEADLVRLDVKLSELSAVRAAYPELVAVLP